jgi:transposase-like protein
MKKSYTPRPEVPKELLERYQAILYALTAQWTVSEAAEKVGIARNHFQTLMHRAMAGMVEALEPGKPGRKVTPESEKELRSQLETLERENERLRQRVETIDRLMGVASGILRGQVQTRGRGKKSKPAKEPGSSGNEPEDPDGEARKRIEEARQLRALGLKRALAAAIVGVAGSTMRRWELRARRGQRVCGRRGPRSSSKLSTEAAAEVEKLVRRMHGLCGADSLRMSVPGVSRRQAASVKSDTLRAMETERVAACTRVHVALPGVIRGADQLYVKCADGMRVALLSADGKVPYRTSACVLARYDAAETKRALEIDLNRNGAPLVYRLDRASAHRAPAVLDLLRAHKVLVLHGPPRYPQYYGQLERQNHEHQCWLARRMPVDGNDLDDAVLAHMLEALNGGWRRRSLGWHTAAEAWEARPPIDVDRDALRDEVTDRAARLRKHLEGNPDGMELARRLAIEQALVERKLISREAGGWC